MTREHQDPELTQAEQRLGIPNGCSQSLLLICLLDLVLMVLVKGGLCCDREGQEVFSSPFSAGSARHSRLMLTGTVKISASPGVQRGEEIDCTKYHSKEGPLVLVGVRSVSQPFHLITVILHCFW